MATEEYAIGYEEGHQAGWNAAMNSLPAQQEQEPVYLVWMEAHSAWLHTDKDGFDKCDPENRWLLYTSPPKLSLAQRQSRSDVKPLTDEEIAKEVEAELTHYWNGEYIDTTGARDQLTAFARVIEAAHGIYAPTELKEKNT